MRGLCVLCVKVGKKTEIDLEQKDSTGRVTIRRFCGGHAQRDPEFFGTLRELKKTFQNPMEWI